MFFLRFLWIHTQGGVYLGHVPDLVAVHDGGDDQYYYHLQFNYFRQRNPFLQCRQHNKNKNNKQRLLIFNFIAGYLL